MPTVVCNRTNPHLVVPHLIVRTPLPAATAVVRLDQLQEVIDSIACLAVRVGTLETWKPGVDASIATLTLWQNENEVRLVQSGMIMLWAADSTPSGWLTCDGSVLTKTDHPDLFAAVGSVFGDGTETALQFRLPNFEKRFVRGWHSDYGAWGTGRNLFDASTAAPVNAVAIPTGVQAGEIAHTHGLAGTWGNTAAGAHNHTVTIPDHTSLTPSAHAATTTDAKGGHWHYIGTADDPGGGRSRGSHGHLSDAVGGHYHNITADAGHAHKTFAATAKFRGYTTPTLDASGVMIWDDGASDSAVDPSTSVAGAHSHGGYTDVVADHSHVVDPCVNGYTAEVGAHNHSVTIAAHSTMPISAHSIATTGNEANHNHGFTHPTDTQGDVGASHTHVVSKVTGWDSETKPDGIWMNFIIKR